MTTTALVSPPAPFARYPEGGRSRLGPPRTWDNCRHGYGLDLQRRTGINTCAYCGVSLVDDYYRWLLLAVDHVVPQSVGRALNIPAVLIQDRFNLVLACAGCNGLSNRYSPPVHIGASQETWTDDAFADLRDRIFADRFVVIANARAKERAFFDSRPWLKPTANIT